MKKENWIKWDLGSRMGLAMSAFVAEHKCEGYGFFVMMTEYFYRAQDNMIPCTSMQTYARACMCNAENAQVYTTALLELGLWKTDGEHVWSDRVCQEVAERETKLSATIEARKRAANKRWAENIKEKNARALQNDADEMQTDAKACQSRLDKIRLDQSKIRVDNNIINSPNGSGVGKEPKTLKLSELEFPNNLNTEQSKQALVEWLSYKKSRKESYRDSRSVQRLLAHWGKLPESQFIEAIDTSIRNGWSGLHDPTPQRQKLKGAINENGYSESFLHNQALKQKILLEDEANAKD